MSSRIEAELALLKMHYDKVDYLMAHAMHWFKVDSLKTPDVPGQWMPVTVPVVFAVTEGHPGVQPYGFFVPMSLNLNGQPPSEHPPPHQPPFEGDWRFLSWQPQGWQATADIQSGSNLWSWVRTFMHRLREGI